MACPEGQYYCHDRGKCMPIPKGKKVRKDGELVSEVAPPGWGHTKAEKEKTKPDKPKSKIGGSAAAFKRALDDGRFKGLPGDKTYKDKKASMFKLMWSMKKKGDKPHYKPGTDKKYKKYQEEDWKPEIEHSKLGDAVKKKREKKRKEAESSLPPHLKLDAMKKAFAHTNEEVEIEERYGSWKQDVKDRDKAAGKKYKKKSINRKKKWREGGHEKLKDVNKPAEKQSMQAVGGFRGVHGANRKSKAAQGKPAPVVYSYQKKVKEETTMKDNNLFGNAYAGSYEDLKKKVGSKKKHDKPAIEENKFVKAMVDAVRKKKEERKPQKAMDAGARAKRKLARKVHRSTVSDFVPKELEDHKTWSDFRKHI